LSLPTAAAQNRQIEDAFFRAAASLEAFLTEWIVRCLASDSSTFAADCEARATNHASGELARWPPAQRLWLRRNRVPTIQVAIPIDRRLSQVEAAAFLGWNDATRSFANARELEELASDYLIPRHAARIHGLSNARKRLLDVTFGIRNVLAHRSSRSVTEMNRRLTASALRTSLQRTGNRVTATGVGFYLRSDGGAGEPRFVAYYEELAEIAYVLAPGGPRTAICPQLRLTP
jgi:hypothetical protein